MKLYELLNQSGRQQADQLDQDQDQNGKFDADAVDGSLQDVAQGVDDQDAQPEPPGGAEQADPNLDDQNVKPIDAALLGQLRQTPYATRYPFDDKSKLAPWTIAKMEIIDLNNLSNMVRFKQQQTTFRDRVGLDDNTDMQFYNDLLQCINTVLKFKKSNTKAQMAANNPMPSWQTRAANDNSAGAVNDNAPAQTQKRA